MNFSNDILGPEALNALGLEILCLAFCEGVYFIPFIIII